MPEPLPARGD